MRLKTNSRLLAQLPALCWTTDESLVLTSSFGGLLDRVGNEQGTLAGQTISQLFSGEQIERVTHAHQRALAGEEAAFDFLWFGRDLHAQLSPLFTKTGDINGVIGVAIDASASAMLQAELIRTRAALATAEYIAHLGSWSHDLRTGVIWWSDELYRILGISSDEHPRERGLWNFDHAEDSDLIALTIAHAASQRIPYEIQHRIMRPNGDVRVVLERGNFGFDHAGNRISEVGTMLDITELATVQQKYRQIQQSFADAERVARMGSWDANLLTGEIWWSPEMYNILGLDPHTTELRLGDLWKYDHPEDREYVVSEIGRARMLKQPYSIKFRVIRGDGKTRTVLERGTDFYDEHGARVRNVGVVVDISHEEIAAREPSVI